MAITRRVSATRSWPATETNLPGVQWPAFAAGTG